MKLNKLSNYALKLYLQSQPDPKQLVAFDVGAKHTGCAVSCFNIKKPYFLKSIKISSKTGVDDYNDYYHKLQVEILKVIKQTKPTALIFGIPQRVVQRQYYQHNQIAIRTLIQGFLDRCKYVKQENKQVYTEQLNINNKNQTNRQNEVINYTLVDENWTTQQATNKLKDIEMNYAKWGHLHKQKQLIDGIAAMKILQRYLTYYNS